MIQHGNLAGEWLIGGVEAKGFAFVLVFLGLEALVLGRWNRTWLLLGAASAFHVLVGGWAAVAAGMTWLLLRLERRGAGESCAPPLRSMWPALAGRPGPGAAGLDSAAVAELGDRRGHCPRGQRDLRLRAAAAPPQSLEVSPGATGSLLRCFACSGCSWGACAARSAGAAAARLRRRQPGDRRGRNGPEPAGFLGPARRRPGCCGSIGSGWPTWPCPSAWRCWAPLDHRPAAGPSASWDAACWRPRCVLAGLHVADCVGHAAVFLAASRRAVLGPRRLGVGRPLAGPSRPNALAAAPAPRRPPARLRRLAGGLRLGGPAGARAAGRRLPHAADVADVQVVCPTQRGRHVEGTSPGRPAASSSGMAA